MYDQGIKYQVLELIKEYIACARYVSGLLKEAAGNPENIIGAYRTTGMPKEGYLEGDIYYNFHGVGCYFELQNTKIDIDFGPGNRCDGFDLYRLEGFHLSRTEKYPELSEVVLKEAFIELTNEGKIYNPKWAPSEHLFYLNG